jgi:8-oxo-dGTP pyrophosphatase MutT (NUDIX family)
MFSRYCYNCGKGNHTHKTCTEPITSIGIIGFKKNKDTNEYEYLMIKRKDTFGYTDFLRGKYKQDDNKYILNLINEMTINEKEKIKNNMGNFDKLWDELWNITDEEYGKKTRFNNDKYRSKMKFNELVENNLLLEYILKSETKWKDQEWEFPKGRREYGETDLETGFREFNEETGINIDKIKLIENVEPLDELFTGTNYKIYLHKYFLCEISNEIELNNYQKSEVSKMEWKSYKECIKSIRKYNLEKMLLIQKVNNLLTSHLII